MGHKKGRLVTVCGYQPPLGLAFVGEFFLDAVEHELEDERVGEHEACEDDACEDLVGEEGTDGEGEHENHVDGGEGLACDFHVACGVGCLCHDVPSSLGAFPLMYIAYGLGARSASRVGEIPANGFMGRAWVSKFAGFGRGEGRIMMGSTRVQEGLTVCFPIGIASFAVGFL